MKTEDQYVVFPLETKLGPVRIKLGGVNAEHSYAYTPEDGITYRGRKYAGQVFFKPILRCGNPAHTRAHDRRTWSTWDDNMHTPQCTLRVEGFEIAHGYSYGVKRLDPDGRADVKWEIARKIGEVIAEALNEHIKANPAVLDWGEYAATADQLAKTEGAITAKTKELRELEDHRDQLRALVAKQSAALEPA